MTKQCQDFSGARSTCPPCCGITLPAIKGLTVIHLSGLFDCGIAMFHKLRYHRSLKHKERDVVSQILLSASAIALLRSCVGSVELDMKAWSSGAFPINYCCLRSVPVVSTDFGRQDEVDWHFEAFGRSHVCKMFPAFLERFCCFAWLLHEAVKIWSSFIERKSNSSGRGV